VLGKAHAEGVELLGPGGLRPQVTMAVLERALAEEMTGHLGYETHDPAVRGSGNSRNCTTPETALTDVGAVDLAVPRDRDGTACESPWSGDGRREAAAKRGRRGEPADV
jgi:transposase-like protein